MIVSISPKRQKTWCKNVKNQKTALKNGKTSVCANQALAFYRMLCLTSSRETTARVYENMKNGKEIWKAAGLAAGMIVTAVCCSCRGPVELDGSFGGVSASDGQEGAVEPVRKTRYVTGIEYPAGYDWMPDLGNNAEGAVLFLMREESRILEIPVGYDNCVSADADMHRCIDGHLYTDFSTDQETVIKKDGAEMFRFFGREMIIGMLERDDGLYTLGQPRSGTGWAYRRNGEIILYKGAGQILHGLYMDGESICFSYMDPIETSGGVRNLYYTVKDGSPQSIPLTDDIIGIDDALTLDGTTYYIARMNAIKGRVLFAGTDAKALELPSDASGISDCRFITDNGSLFISGNISGGGGTGYGDSFWNGTTLICSAGGEYRVCGSRVDGGKCHYAARAPYDGSTIRVYMDGTTRLLAAGYELIYQSAFGAGNGSCCLALSDTADSDRPLIWTDGNVTAYEFNGAFTSVSYW